MHVEIKSENICKWLVTESDRIEYFESKTNEENLYFNRQLNAVCELVMKS